jgi:hypothetical protein
VEYLWVKSRVMDSRRNTYNLMGSPALEPLITSLMRICHVLTTPQDSSFGTLFSITFYLCTETQTW